jgi:hypothetical protein
MRRAYFFVAAAIVVGCAAVAMAQAKPDFSGRWTTDPDPAAAPQAAAPPAGATGRAGAPPAAGGQRGGRAGDMGSGWGSTITITQDAARLTVEYAFFSRGDMQPPLKFVYNLDGSETKNSVMMGRGIQGQISKTAWEGDRLAITTTHTFPDPAGGKPTMVDVKQVLLLESPTSLAVETTRTTPLGGPAKTTRTVYRKS